MIHFKVSEIWIYPIKSMGGIALKHALVKRKGLEHDRRWMLIDESNVAMTQRLYPKMSLFRPHVRNGKIFVTFTKATTGNDLVEFSIAISKAAKPITAKVWDDEVQVHEVDPVLSEWFSNHLQTSCRLVAFPEDSPRKLDSVNDEHVSLADAYPFLIIGQRSLDDLNARLIDAVSMHRFRPNFVFTGGEPFIEDHWRNLTIGEIPFVAVKKSDRCVLTTVNQDTGEKGTEPLRTLSTYRKVASKVYFGQNLVALSEGHVRVGDTLIPG